MDPKTKAAPFQTDQLKRIVEVLGTPNKDRWPSIESMPDYKGGGHTSASITIPKPWLGGTLRDTNPTTDTTSSMRFSSTIRNNGSLLTRASPIRV